MVQWNLIVVSVKQTTDTSFSIDWNGFFGERLGLAQGKNNPLQPFVVKFCGRLSFIITYCAFVDPFVVAEISIVFVI